MKKYQCGPCGYIYDPEVGDPDSGIAPGTAFEDLPDDWCCPLCGVSKDMFEPVEQDKQEEQSSFYYSSNIAFLFINIPNRSIKRINNNAIKAIANIGVRSVGSMFRYALIAHPKP